MQCEPCFAGPLLLDNKITKPVDNSTTPYSRCCCCHRRAGAPAPGRGGATLWDQGVSSPPAEEVPGLSGAQPPPSAASCCCHHPGGARR